MSFNDVRSYLNYTDNMTLQLLFYLTSHLRPIIRSAVIEWSVIQSGILGEYELRDLVI